MNELQSLLIASANFHGSVALPITAETFRWRHEELTLMSKERAQEMKSRIMVAMRMLIERGEGNIIHCQCARQDNMGLLLESVPRNAPRHAHPRARQRELEHTTPGSANDLNVMSTRGVRHTSESAVCIQQSDVRILSFYDHENARSCARQGRGRHPSDRTFTFSSWMERGG